MTRKPGNCSIKLPDTSSASDVCSDVYAEIEFNFKKRQQLINFGHSQWGFKNWSWSVVKQDLDFTDYSNGKFSVGVAAFVTVTVNSLGIHRGDVGYATSTATQKGSAIHQARKSAVTNALRETLFSFGGQIASSLYEQLEVINTDERPSTTKAENEDTKPDIVTHAIGKQNFNLEEPKNSNTKNSLLPPGQSHRSDAHQKESKINGNMRPVQSFAKSPGKIQAQLPINNFLQPVPDKAARPANQPSLIAKQIIGGPPANQVPAKMQSVKPHPPSAPTAPLHSVVIPQPPASVPPHIRSNSNVSFVLQPVMSGLMPGMMQPLYSMQCATAPHTPPPSRMPLTPAHIYPNAYFAEYAPWHLTCDNYDRHHPNMNGNYNIPPKNLLINTRPGAVDCKNICGLGKTTANGISLEIDSSLVHGSYAGHQPNATWIKPTIFYDGFWTEQKVKKWVAEQSDKPSANEDASHGNPLNTMQNQPCHSKV